MVKFFFQKVEMAMCLNDGLFQNPKGSKALGVPLSSLHIFHFKGKFQYYKFKTWI
jgi:hypothetical protein